MTYSQMIRIGIGVVLGTSILTGCGPGETPVTEDPSPESEAVAPDASAPDSAVSDPADSPDDAASEETSPSEANTPEPSTPQTDVSDSSATAEGETLINPPQAATLTARQAGSRINLRSQPTTDSERQGYGLVGDDVELLRAAEGSDELTWYYVKFDESGAEGWIRGDFIDTAEVTASATTASNSTSAAGNNSAEVSIDSFTTDEIFAVGSGGCGMTLWPSNTNEFIFFNGLDNTGMWMKLDGDMIQFRRTAASGPEFYGQSGSQSFVSLDGAYEVDVTTTAGSDKGYEAINIDSGTLTLKTAGDATDIAVEGDAGC
ncbi:SH3 domain-containing protein [Oscillatoria sp. CS-180]|uniref:SH3 domain-containing protein n=1 Tax=Oscillatoria sp. CS-180 TaxID=3021720 RepID=UPI00232C8304|nr:SH3 domain-containing protein [Oscillatoria sp. CS-180]MDB9527702.1 SH3 domain-containing protein [Oscillatoria sp. CS-180]